MTDAEFGKACDKHESVIADALWGRFEGGWETDDSGDAPCSFCGVKLADQCVHIRNVEDLIQICFPCGERLMKRFSATILIFLEEIRACEAEYRKEASCKS